MCSSQCQCGWSEAPLRTLSAQVTEFLTLCAPQMPPKIKYDYVGRKAFLPGMLQHAWLRRPLLVRTGSGRMCAPFECSSQLCLWALWALWQRRVG